MGRLIARAFWGPRPQSLDDGVAAIVATLSGLRDLDVEHYERWFDLGESPENARCSFSTTSKWVKNRVVFGLPSAWDHDLDRARQALDLVVRVWQPEQANVWTSDNVNLVVADL